MKKILSYSLALGILGSAMFIPYSNASAASLSKAETAVKTAEKHAGELKWQISYETTKVIKTPDMKAFNATKLAYLQAKKEISASSGSEKQKLEQRLEDNVGIHYERTIGYVDAITSGNKIATLTKKFQQQYRDEPTADSTEKTYHELSAEIRKQAKLLYKVYGKSTRDAFLATFKAPAEKLLDDAKYTITAKSDLRKLNTLVGQNANQVVVENQVNQLFNSLDKIVEDEIYYTLFDIYSLTIRNDASFLAQEKELKQFFATTNDLINKEDVDGVFNLYNEAYPDYEYLKKDIQDAFDQFNMKFELLDVNVLSILDGYAYVEVTDRMTEGTETDTLTSVYLMIKENNAWKYFDIYDAY